jgi:hypothetical protein
MKVLRLITASLVVAGVLCAGLFVVGSQRTANRIRHKAAQAQQEVKDLALHGGDPSAVLTILAEVKPALDAGEAGKAERLLDRALSLLEQTPATAADRDDSPLPVFGSEEKASGLFKDPQPVTIAGYEGSAMEPFISTDGKFLFFNNSNDRTVNTNLYFAKRTGDREFRFLGELPGVNTASLDAVASIDSAGHFYFTTLREFERTSNSIYTGEFDGKEVKNVRPVAGTISPTIPFAVNMDVSISPDGQTLYISRAVIVPGASAPKKSELMLARMTNGAFAIAADSDRILKNINTGALEYAPAISANGLELYFTRASQSEPGRSETGAKVRIMVATRSSANEPFGEPRVLSALTGFVEAPSISLDGGELFFHKKVGDKYVIYRADRVLR